VLLYLAPPPPSLLHPHPQAQTRRPRESHLLFLPRRGRKPTIVALDMGGLSGEDFRLTHPTTHQNLRRRHERRRMKEPRRRRAAARGYLNDVNWFRNICLVVRKLSDDILCTPPRRATASRHHPPRYSVAQTSTHIVEGQPRATIGSLEGLRQNHGRHAFQRGGYIPPAPSPPAWVLHETKHR
jgi:hypothetical protein